MKNIEGLFAGESLRQGRTILLRLTSHLQMETLICQDPGRRIMDLQVLALDEHCLR
jgi:hypothetical protein